MVKGLADDMGERLAGLSRMPPEHLDQRIRYVERRLVHDPIIIPGNESVNLSFDDNYPLHPLLAVGFDEDEI